MERRAWEANEETHERCGADFDESNWVEIPEFSRKPMVVERMQMELFPEVV
jgi:hypothetical protein